VTSSPDIHAAAARLSEGQRACLRLVARGRSSKEIALETGLSPQTVDTYLKQAMARLGVTSRREAARFLEQHEGAPPSQISGSPSGGLVEPDGPDDPSAEARGRSWTTWAALPPVGGRPNELGAGARTFAVLRIAVIAATTVVAMALVIAGGLSTFR
jgi:DNA-binding CsgD family transcriptional regulator